MITAGLTPDHANELLERAGSEYRTVFDGRADYFYRAMIEALLDRIEALEARVSELEVPKELTIAGKPFDGEDARRFADMLVERLKDEGE